MEEILNLSKILVVVKEKYTVEIVWRRIIWILGVPMPCFVHWSVFHQTCSAARQPPPPILYRYLVGVTVRIMGKLYCILYLNYYLFNIYGRKYQCTKKICPVRQLMSLGEGY